MIRGRLSTDLKFQSRNLIQGASPPTTISLETFHQWAVLNCFHLGGIQGTSKSSPLSLMTIAKLLNVMSLYLNYLLLLFLHRLPRACQATLPPVAGTASAEHIWSWGKMLIKETMACWVNLFPFELGRSGCIPALPLAVWPQSKCFISVNLSFLFDEQANGCFTGFQGVLELNL